jgi:hypothetical protein
MTAVGTLEDQCLSRRAQIQFLTQLFQISGLWLANCYFAHDSSGFPALRRFCDAQSGRASLLYGI